MEKPQTSNRNEFYNNLIEKEQVALELFFSGYLPDNFKPKSILNFCAGVANEEPILQKKYGDDITIISFDNNDYILQLVKDLNLDRKSLIKLDLGQITEYFKNTHFDLVLGRNIPINPNNGDSNEQYQDEWPDFINNVRMIISLSGYLLITLAREDEFYRAKELLEKSEFVILTEEMNKIIIPSDRIGIAGADIKDNYVILCKLPSDAHT